MKDAEIIQFMKKHHGYARTTDLLRERISFRDIKKLLKTERIERVKNGLYRLKDDDCTPMRDFVDACQAIPKAVICLYSSLSHYELTTFVPAEIMVAIPQKSHVPKIAYRPIRAFYFSKRQYEENIETVKTREGIYRIYSPEKSICDAFRFRKKLGDDTAKEALFAYLEKKDRDLKKLLECAEVCRMSNVMKPYIEARIG